VAHYKSLANSQRAGLVPPGTTISKSRISRLANPSQTSIPLYRKTSEIANSVPHCEPPIHLPYRILSFGRDSLLLDIRRCLFAIYFDSILASTLAEIESLQATPVVDLLILCHTLSEQECYRATAITHRRWPAVQILSLCCDRKPCHHVSNHVIDPLDGPRALLRTVCQILQAPIQIA
jgi:hypothetical protein